MKQCLIAVLSVSMLLPSVAFAGDESTNLRLSLSGAETAAAIANVTGSRSQNVPTPLEGAEKAERSSGMRAAQGSRGDSWIGRHPVLFGALVGLGVGVSASAAYLPESGNPDVTKGQYVTLFGLLGSGVGAGMGALVSVMAR